MSDACPRCGGRLSGTDALCPDCLKRVALREAVDLDESDASALNDLLPESAQRKPGVNSAAIAGAVTGERWGDYELLESIGRGAMGTVFKARHARLNRLVALKVISQGSQASEVQRQRFLREAEAVARLQHPHIVTLYDTGEVEGQPYLAMEYVAGKTLAESIVKNPLPPRQAAGCVKKISEAVHYAHDHGVLHRDLKPSNVALDLNLEPRVMDFGLARLVEQDSEMTLTGMAIGSPSYMAPEQAAGKVHEVSAASDVYALGAILYETLTARPPFQAESSVETMRQVVEKDPVSPRLLNASVPRDLETICLKCLEKEPRRRYSTAHELAEDLGRFVRDEPIVARPIGAPARLARWCRRKPALAGWIGAAALLLLLIVIGSPVAILRVNRERQAAATEAAKSRQVATFLASMLEGVKPSVASGRDTALLRDLLDQTAKRLDTEFKDQPEVEAQLRLVVGQVYEALEFTVQAEQHLRTAWALRGKWLGEQHAETLAAKLALARALEVGHKWSEAKTLAGEVLQVCREQFGDRDLRTIEALHLLGNALKRGREFEASAAVLREMVALKKEVYGNDNLVVFSAMEALGTSLIAAGQPGEAALVFEESLRGFEKLSLTNSPGAAFALGWLGVARNGQDRFAEADALQRDSLAMKRRLLPEDHPSIAWHQYYQAECWLVQARFPEAESLLIESWNIAGRHTTESLHLKRCLALFADRLYAARGQTDPTAASKAKEWRDKLDELDRQHPELREQH